MKEIKTINFLKKEGQSQYPSYPPGISERDIADQAGHKESPSNIHIEKIDNLRAFIDVEEFDKWYGERMFVTDKKQIPVYVVAKVYYDMGTQEVKDFRLLSVRDEVGEQLLEKIPDLSDFLYDQLLTEITEIMRSDYYRDEVPEI